MKKIERVNGYTTNRYYKDDQKEPFLTIGELRFGSDYIDVVDGSKTIDIEHRPVRFEGKGEKSEKFKISFLSIDAVLYRPYVNSTVFNHWKTKVHGNCIMWGDVNYFEYTGKFEMFYHIYGIYRDKNRLLSRWMYSLLNKKHSIYEKKRR